MEMERAAFFNHDTTHRYSLCRRWEPGKLVNFIMLNPSKADAEVDDSTVRKCIGFAKRWGFGRLVVTNLLPNVATNPQDLPRWSGNNHFNAQVRRVIIQEADLIVVAWGSPDTHLRRQISFSELLYHMRGQLSGRALFCIGTTKKGDPLHPSRTAYTDAPVPWSRWVD